MKAIPSNDNRMATEGLRLTVNLSKMTSRRLIIWAKAHDKTKSAYAAQIIESRIEANLAKIDELLEQCARDEGISPRELEQKWLIEEGFIS